MTHADYFMTALCLWREARGEGNSGMTAVGCVIRNRVTRDNKSYYAEVVKPWQFSSITAKGDPQLVLFPDALDGSWQQAVLVAGNIIGDVVSDITGGATLYFDDSIPFPRSWNPAAVQATVKLGRLNFYKEI